MSDTISRRRMTAPPPLTLKSADQLRIIDATLRFITPVFGGGVRVTAEKQTKHLKQPDPITPVRGASLRGQLREWWRRACCIGLPIEVMRDRESILWGWASTSDHPAKGWVSLSVDQDQLGPPKAVSLDEFKDGVKYGGFPLRPEQGAGPGVPDGKLHSYSGTFAVRIEARPLSAAGLRAARAAWPSADVEREMWAEVERAFLAWSTLGGLGARTRRGFGAVEAVQPAKTTYSELMSKLGWAPTIAALSKWHVYKTAEEAMEFGLAQLRDFRQGVNVGRNAGPGRSRWPEADSIRLLTGHYWEKHSPTHKLKARYPRAAFGLPIIFHFKDKVRGDPQSQTLYPRGPLDQKQPDRLASPVAIRPIWTGNGYCALALHLPSREDLGHRLERLRIVGQAPPGSPVSGLLLGGEALLIPPMAVNLGAHADGPLAVIESFFKFFSK